MKILLTAQLLGTLLTTARNFAPVVGQDCIGGLADVFLNEYLNPLLPNPFNVSATRTYILCSNTTFNTTDIPLVLAKPNVEIYCGSLSGSSDNNCIFEGGPFQDFQVLVSDNGVTVSNAVNTVCLPPTIPPAYQALCDTYYPSVPSDFPSYSVDNVHVHGITFTGPVDQNVFVGVPGDVTFEDCMFMDSGPALLILSGAGNRMLVEHLGNITVTLSECTFSNNALNMSGDALITNVGHSLNVIGCDFINTEAPIIIYSQGGTLNLTDNCFYNNTVEEFLIAVIDGMYDQSGNAAAETTVNNPDFTCDSLYVQTDSSEPECIPFDGGFCEIFGTQVPSAAPSVAPTTSLAPTLSQAPSASPSVVPTESFIFALAAVAGAVGFIFS